MINVLGTPNGSQSAPLAETGSERVFNVGKCSDPDFVTPILRKCNTKALVIMDGRATCLNGGYSKCG